MLNHAPVVFVTAVREGETPAPAGPSIKEQLADIGNGGSFRLERIVFAASQVRSRFAKYPRTQTTVGFLRNVSRDFM